MLLGVGLVIGVIATLFLQAASRQFMDWWYDVLDVARSWVSTILGVCGVLFVILVITYAAGWRP